MLDNVVRERICFSLLSEDFLLRRLGWCQRSRLGLVPTSSGLSSGPTSPGRHLRCGEIELGHGAPGPNLRGGQVGMRQLCTTEVDPSA